MRVEGDVHQDCFPWYFLILKIASSLELPRANSQYYGPECRERFLAEQTQGRRSSETLYYLRPTYSLFVCRTKVLSRFFLEGMEEYEPSSPPLYHIRENFNNLRKRTPTLLRLGILAMDDVLYICLSATDIFLQSSGAFDAKADHKKIHNTASIPKKII